MYQKSITKVVKNKNIKDCQLEKVTEKRKA